jgi:hypothetical protein
MDAFLNRYYEHDGDKASNKAEFKLRPVAFNISRKQCALKPQVTTWLAMFILLG